MKLKAPYAFATLIVSTIALGGPCKAASSSLIIDRDRSDRATGASLSTSSPSATPNLSSEKTEELSITPFRLTEVRVEGSSLDANDIGALSRDVIGKTIDTKGLDRLAKSLSALYEKSDIALYTIVVPEQDFAGGVLRLKVVEGYVTNVIIHVDGRQKVTKQIQRYAEALTHQRPLRRPALERTLSLIRDIPGLAPQFDLQRSHKPGAVTLAVEADQKTFATGLNIDNRGTALLGRTQITANADLNSLFRAGDNTHLTVATPTQVKRFQYYALSHSQLLNDEGTILRGNVGYLRTRPDAAPAGDAILAGLQIQHPILRSYERSLYFIGSFDGLNSSNGLLGQTIADERTRVLRSALVYSRMGGKTSYSAAINGSQGLAGLGSRINDTRGAKTNFRKLNINAAFGHQLTEAIVLRLSAMAQYSRNRLPASEMFALGGDYGRAFDAATLTGDYGFAGSGELAWGPTFLPSLVQGAELYGFVDGGKAWSRIRGFPSVSYRLASTGLGLRLPVTSKAAAQLEFAKPLETPSYLPDSRKWRAIFSIQTRL